MFKNKLTRAKFDELFSHQLENPIVPDEETYPHIEAMIMQSNSSSKVDVSPGVRIYKYFTKMNKSHRLRYVNDLDQAYEAVSGMNISEYKYNGGIPMFVLS